MRLCIKGVPKGVLSRLHEAMKNAGREAEFSEAFSDTSRLDELCREFGIS